MKTQLIKVLKDTPFDKSGAVITLYEFKKKYSWAFISSLRDDGIIEYLMREFNLAKNDKTDCNSIGTYFEPITTLEECPLTFIHNGLIYSKELDGTWHIYIDFYHFEFCKRNNYPGIGFKTERECLLLINSSKVQQTILVTKDIINMKL